MPDTKIELQGISHGGIDCLDLSRTLAFYTEALNMRVFHRSADGRTVWLACENGQLFRLQQVEQLAPMVTRRFAAEGRLHDGHHSHAALVVHPDEYTAAIQRLTDWGTPGLAYGRPRDPDPSLSSYYFFDPEGYGLHFQREKAPTAPTGASRMQAIDHFTYEVSDLERVLRFYDEVLDVPLLKRHPGPIFHAFCSVNGHAVGFFPEEDLKGVRDPAAAPDSPVFWAYEVAADAFEGVLRRLDALEVEYVGPSEHPSDWPITRDVRFNDADGFNLEVAVRR